MRTYQFSFSLLSLFLLCFIFCCPWFFLSCGGRCEIGKKIEVPLHEYILRDPLYFGDYRNAALPDQPRYYEDLIDYDACYFLLQEVCQQRFVHSRHQHWPSHGSYTHPTSIRTCVRHSNIMIIIIILLESCLYITINLYFCFAEIRVYYSIHNGILVVPRFAIYPTQKRIFAAIFIFSFALFIYSPYSYMGMGMYRFIIYCATVLCQRFT